MFAGCTGLNSLDVSSFDTSRAVNAVGMLAALYNLERINIGPDFFKNSALINEAPTNIADELWSPENNLSIRKTWKQLGQNWKPSDAGWWVAAGETWTVKFVTNGGTAIAPVAALKQRPFDPYKYVPTRPGYEFTGWYYDSACKNKVSGSEWLYENTTYYAGWKKAQITVTFDTAGGTVVSPASGEY